ncbi:PREDICTED: glutathione synthetase-like isoform X2 [Dinoponera quadriceps]|uniref:Glutathione synthetase n=1 Tax=Dinoponera quadriceps TaxID=609295 RepID=A0A6P3XCZ0_DINQU|nr:PREDICTED: glutathione synthetase-like isoform X2 [Dinoponera quadriceps]
MHGDNQATMKLPITLNLPRKELDELIDKAKDWALMNGTCFRSKTNFNRDLLQFAPFTLLPSPFPREEFQNACNIQIILNTLIHRVAHDYDFLKETLRETVKVDEFTRNLFDIYETVHREGAAQKLSLGILRSDLMLDTSCPKKNAEKLKPHCCWKQVEINTIASGFGWLGPATTRLHRFILQELGYTDELRNLPENNALESLCSGMIEAWSLYGDPKSGYEPGQYHTQKEWDARLLIERSLAIKCPSIQYHLAGTKKVQQTLAKPGTVACFLKDEKTAAKVREIFTGLYPLDFDEHGNSAVEMGISEPQRFVLKPQREGGCNNKYGTDIRDFLQSVKSEQARVAWILMDRLYPPVHRNYVVKPGSNAEPETKELISELGIFGVIIGSDKEIIVNRLGGHMLRTKLSTDNEGGVASGLGACDSPFLID